MLDSDLAKGYTPSPCSTYSTSVVLKDTKYFSQLAAAHHLLGFLKWTQKKDLGLTQQKSQGPQELIWWVSGWFGLGQTVGQNPILSISQPLVWGLKQLCAGRKWRWLIRPAHDCWSPQTRYSLEKLHSVYVVKGVWSFLTVLFLNPQLDTYHMLKCNKYHRYQ